MQAMRWLQLRGAAVRDLKFHAVRLPNKDKAARDQYCLQGASMLLLPQLPNLQHLTISGENGSYDSFMIPERHLPIIRLLPCLKSLSLQVQSDGTWKEHTLAPLSHLRALTSLHLCINGTDVDPMWLSPSLTHLTRLQDLRLHCRDPCHDEEHSDHMMGIVSRLTTLRMLCLDGLLEDFPAQLGALAKLTRLDVWNLRYPRQLCAIPPSFSLCTNLQHLCLQGPRDICDELWQHVCELLILLPKMTDLTIDKIHLPKVQPSSWSLPLALTSLVLSDCSLRIFPAAVCSLPRLQNLQISDPRFRGLREATFIELMAFPAGPYLHHLQKLEINIPRVGPEALEHATKLQVLGIVGEADAKPLWTRNALESLLPKGCEIIFIE